MPESIYIAGPTASGKSAVALEVADRLGGEIISVDSMQVYRGLDIGTAKPSTHERARVRHHLLDVAELAEHFDVAQFLARLDPLGFVPAPAVSRLQVLELAAARPHAANQDGSRLARHHPSRLLGNRLAECEGGSVFMADLK